MGFSIDGNLVNDRIDWDFNAYPQRADQRMETYPGQSEEFLVTGPAKNMTYRVTGTIEAADVNSLMSLADTYAQLNGDGLEHAFTIDGVNRTACVVTGFHCIDQWYPADDKLCWDVVFEWHQLRKEVTGA